MSDWQYVLELNGRAERLADGGCEALSLPDELRGRTLLVTDFQGAPFGVEALESGIRQVAPVVEKRLRDSGEIDEIARLLIHDSQRQGDMVQVFYSAIAVTRYLRYRSWCEAHPDHLLLFPLAEALLAVARGQALDDGVLLFRHGDSVDVLICVGGRVVAASRLQRFADSHAEEARIAAAILQLRQHHMPGSGAVSYLLIEARAGAAQTLMAELAASGELDCREPAQGVDLLFRYLTPAQADRSLTERITLLGAQLLPWAGAAMLSLCVLAAGLALVWRHDAQQLEARLTQARQSDLAALHEQLKRAQQASVTLQNSQQQLVDFSRLLARAGQTPNPAMLINHLRQAVPEGIALTEVGILSEDAGVLIVISGRSATAAAPLDAEERLVTALKALGYRVVKREIEGDKGNSLFRLALTWSEA